jgi:UDP-galactopyranose mutase
VSAVDLLIVGAGPTGCVIADRAARLLGWRSLVIDKRPHIAGNCYDRYHDSGLFMHEYGPHYFRTNSAALLDYLSQFAAFHRADYIVRASHRGQLLPFPINLTTLEQFFGTGPLTPESGERLLSSKRERFEAPANSEELVLSRVGRELYQAFYESYTSKQWGRHPRELDASVCGRIPVRLSRDQRYVDHRYQVMPSAGFTAMFAAMLNHPEIEVRLGTDFAAVRGTIRPRRATVFCGPLDEYFEHRLGRLPWRSLSFDFRLLNQRWAQPCVQINYPTEHAFTRSVEIKHITRQDHPQTLVVDEYPRAEGEPYYPVPSAEARALCEAYRELAREETRLKRVYFCGRLAEYRYVNTDEAIERALDLVNVMRTECSTLDSNLGAS